ncbi:uncharacterized protein LOC105939776 [Fundulus heteroclitus]|uniref:uncharacterized protein LOC105939776 n=1 Tax=Fundulus heteroclitus TaxID=8078 RepID=UPI00165BCB61|nr:uncharacterized protein LOC105939776 [Fundulus heteroclitus]
MSISVATEKGVTVVAIATDSQSMLPPWCQIIKALFSCPLGRSVKNVMMPSSVVVALGTVQVMVGLFNIGLGPERVEAYPYWLGVFFTVAGAVSIFAGRFPLPCLVGFSIVVNIAGSILSIVAVVLYALHLASFTVVQMCAMQDDRNSENCIFLAGLAQRLLRAVDITMIVMSVLQLCVCISLTVLSIKALCYRGKDQDVTDVEMQPLLEEDHLTSPGP